MYFSSGGVSSKSDSYAKDLAEVEDAADGEAEEEEGEEKEGGRERARDSVPMQGAPRALEPHPCSHLLPSRRRGPGRSLGPSSGTAGDSTRLWASLLGAAEGGPLRYQDSGAGGLHREGMIVAPYRNVYDVPEAAAAQWRGREAVCAAVTV